VRPKISETTAGKLRLAVQDIVGDQQVPVEQLSMEAQTEVLLEAWAKEKRSPETMWKPPWDGGLQPADSGPGKIVDNGRLIDR
jgi:hypothetical protein